MILILLVNMNLGFSRRFEGDYPNVCIPDGLVGQRAKVTGKMSGSKKRVDALAFHGRSCYY